MKRPPKKPTQRRLKRPARKPVQIDLYRIALQLGNAHVPSPTFGKIIREARQKKVFVFTIGQAMWQLGYSREKALRTFKQHFIEWFKVSKIRPNIPIINALAESAMKEQYDRFKPTK